jgi:Spy/CpxP family protein refolding chaperone
LLESGDSTICVPKGDGNRHMTDRTFFRGAIVMKINAKFLMVAVAVIATAATSAARAQGPGGGRGMGGGPGGGDPAFLIIAEPVQKELELSDEQKASIQKFRDDMMADGQNFFSQLQGLSPDEIQKKMQERGKENRKKIADILLPPQMERLDEITIQFAGPAALNRDEVAEKVGLSGDQKGKIKDIADDTRQKMFDMFSSFGGPPADDKERQERREKMTKLNTEQNDKIMGVLTGDQKTKFEQLKGKTFDTSSVQFGRGFGRGPGGGGQKGGN